MKKIEAPTHLFIDIGGVLLTDGWNREIRKNAALHFKLDLEEMESRHHLIFETYEMGKFTLVEYLQAIIFYKKRSFTLAQFKSYMFAQSKAFPDMLDLIRQLKLKYRLTVFVVSNEARELNAFRIKKFKLNHFVDVFFSSCYLAMRKPDPAIFKLALDASGVNPNQIVYIENTAFFVQMAEEFGIRSILHKDLNSTSKELSLMGLTS